MTKLWITLPVENVNIQLPTSMAEGDVKVSFNNVEAIEQLNELKKNHLSYFNTN
jgi:hypothetical protein